MTDLERFHLMDEVRRICDQQGIGYSGDSWTRENVAWIFEKARLQITSEATCSGLPELALSVRQPWAWAIIYGGKDIENRDWKAGRVSLHHLGRIAIHASKRMTREDYADGFYMMANVGVTCPPAMDLPRGGIIGSVEIVDVVSKSDSPWFYGPVGLVLKDPTPHPFIQTAGALGFFQWKFTPRF